LTLKNALLALPPVGSEMAGFSARKMVEATKKWEPILYYERQYV
jgi:hypothetical protein